MMGDDPPDAPATAAAGAATAAAGAAAANAADHPACAPVRRRRRPIDADPVVANLRRAYAETLAEPLPPALAALLRRLE